MSTSLSILDRPDRAGARVRHRRLRSQRQIEQALSAAKRKQVWVIRSDGTVAVLLRAMSRAAPGARGANLVCYVSPPPASAQMIESGFGRALVATPAMIAFDELAEVLGRPHPEDYCVAVDWDPDSLVLALWRGDLSTVLLPLGEFPPRGGVAPDPSRLSIADHGQTVRLGDYEVSVDAVLYARDPVYRRRAKRRMIASEQGLGPSIRRLRLSRGCGRSEFPGLGEKTLARIERGEVERPQRRTLETIAATLGVPVDELGDF